MVFSLFDRKAPKSSKEKAKLAFEKVTAVDSDSRTARSARIRMGLLCRAGLDRAFIEGAERTRVYQERSFQAVRQGREFPAPPEAECYFQVRVNGEGIYVYLPEEYANEAFSIGARYQRAEIDARAAIDLVQALADQICTYELKLDEAFRALQFLRDEVAAENGAIDGKPRDASNRSGK